MFTRLVLVGLFAIGLLGTIAAPPACAQKLAQATAGQFKTFYVIEVKFKSRTESWTRWAEYSTRQQAEAYVLTLLRSRYLADIRIVTVVRYVPTVLPNSPPTLP